MNTNKITQLVDEFIIKIAETQFDKTSPPNKKASDFSPEEESFINSLSGKDKNPAQDENDVHVDEKTWKRAKKTVKKYWKKYDEPWAVVYDVYKKMGGKPKKKSRKK